MKKILLAAVAMAAVAGGSAFAAPTSGTLTINGTAGAFCTLPAGPTAGTITLATDLATAATGVLNAAELTAITADVPVLCNGAGTTVKMTTTSMKGNYTGTVPRGFANQVNFVAKLSLDSGYLQGFLPAPGLSSLAGVSDTKTAGLTNAVIQFDIDSAATPGVGDVMIAGDYTGKVEVTISPGV
jgi:hypothetical protein